MARSNPPQGRFVEVRTRDDDRDLLPARRPASFRRPASPAGPAPSARLCVGSRRIRIASAISASDTVTKSASPARSGSNASEGLTILGEAPTSVSSRVELTVPR
jgi:hypothetical protein